MRATLLQRGFTLAGTLTTLAIAGIGFSSASAQPPIAGNNSPMVSENQLVATMQITRSGSITRDAHLTLCPSRSGGNCDDHRWEQGWIAFVESDADGERNLDQRLIDQLWSLTGAEPDEGR